MYRLTTFYEGSFSTMPAVKKLDKMPLTIIRPLCLEHEKDIAEYAMLRSYAKQEKTCPHERETNRTQMKRIFEEIEKNNPEARYSENACIAYGIEFVRESSAWLLI